MKKVFVLKQNSEIICGEGSLSKLLEIPHEGEVMGNRIMLLVLHPVGKKKKLIDDNTMYLLNVQYQKDCNGKLYSDLKFYNEISFHVDDFGNRKYMSVPTEWMEEA